MKRYKKVMIALDLHDKSDSKVIEKAQDVKETFDAELSLIHCVEHLSNYGAAYGVSAGIDVEQEMVKEASQELQNIGSRLDISEANQSVKVGPAKQMILEHAESIGADLIIVGSHGRHGVRLLLGSTANAVIHGAKCDVLAVRVED